MSKETIIPPITHELGKYWKQPNVSEMLIDDEYAIMTEQTLEKLSNYSHSNPTGAYAGKMWRSEILTLNKSQTETLCKTNYLHWYVDYDENSVCTETREIIFL